MNLFSIYREARKLMAELNINSLPINPFKVIECLGIEIMSYSEAETIDSQYKIKIQKLRIKEVDAVSIIMYSPKTNKFEYLILYDDNRSQDRINFTLIHEVAHIRLRHLSRQMSSCTRCSQTTIHSPIEKEADEFAGEFLRPAILLILLGLTNNPLSIAQLCQVSKSCAEVGINKINNGLIEKFNTSYVSITRFYSTQFFNFINTKYCKNCGYKSALCFRSYCPICGEQNFIPYAKSLPFVSPIEYPEEIKLDKHNRALVCPVCKHCLTDKDAKYCEVCEILIGKKTYLFNHCSGEMFYDTLGNPYYTEAPCHNPHIKGNHRYCTICGKETTFFKNNILKHWIIEKRKLNYKSIRTLDTITSYYDHAFQAST